MRERKILTFKFARHPPLYLYPWGCSSYWPSHCESQCEGLSCWKCPLSPSEIDNNRNEDIGTTAGKCSSIDGICWNLPLALGVARGPAKSPEWGRLLKSRLWPNIINYLMELWLYETLGRMGVGSSRGHLMIRHTILRHLMKMKMKITELNTSNLLQRQIGRRIFKTMDSAKKRFTTHFPFLNHCNVIPLVQKMNGTIWHNDCTVLVADKLLRNKSTLRNVTMVSD